MELATMQAKANAGRRQQLLQQQQLTRRKLAMWPLLVFLQLLLTWESRMQKLSLRLLQRQHQQRVEPHAGLVQLLLMPCRAS
jgi:hypothetical protein